MTARSTSPAWRWFTSPVVDQVAVARVVTGSLPYPPLTRAERAAAVAAMTAAGVPNAEQARRLGVDKRSVERIVSALRAAA